MLDDSAADDIVLLPCKCGRCKSVHKKQTNIVQNKTKQQQQQQQQQKRIKVFFFFFNKNPPGHGDQGWTNLSKLGPYTSINEPLLVTIKIPASVVPAFLDEICLISPNLVKY